MLGIIDMKIPWCYKKHYLLLYFQSSNCFTSSFFRMHFCVNEDGGRITNAVPAYEYNSSKIRTNISDLFSRQETLRTRLQHSILGTTLL